jgi:hypothetical protein
MAGRPPKKMAERRSNVLRIRLNEGERKSLDGAARIASLDVSAWARMILLTTAKEKNTPTAQR